MKAFFGTSLYETEVEKATSEKNTTEQWDIIMEICDKAGKSSDDARACLKAIYKRLNNNDPHVQLHAATLLDACVSNCGKHFHTEVASREFEKEFTRFLEKCHPKVQLKLKESLKKWAEGDFKSDPQLNLIPSLYNKLRSSGIDFTVGMPAKKTVQLSKDPNVVQSAEEEEQIAKAIELSLKETSGSPRNTASVPATSSIYPTANLASATLTSTTTTSATPPKELRKVRTLYDFEAAEDNELTFTAGEIIFVIDDSDGNWWKGSNQRGEGLFPANFVTADLSVEPEQLVTEKNKKLVQFSDHVEVKNVDPEPQEVEINEEKIDRLLHLLHDADTTNPENDDDEMLRLEREANAMGPMIDSELERVDRKHAQLTKLSTDLVDALSLYHSLMREPQFQAVNKLSYQFPPNSQPASGIYHNGSLPPQSSVAPQFIIGQPVNGPPMPGGQQQDGQMAQQSMPPPHSMMGPPGPGGSAMMLPPHFIYGEARGAPMPPYGPLPSLPPGAQTPVGVPSNSSSHHVFPPGMGPSLPPHHMAQAGSMARFSHQGLPQNFAPQSIPPGFDPAGSVPNVGSQTVLQGSASSKQLPGQFASASSTHLM